MPGATPMATPLDQLGPGAHVAIIRLRSLGDCVLTTPAIALLHQYRPDLRIGIVVDPPFLAIFRGIPAISAILPPTIAAVRKFTPRITLNLHGGARSMVLTATSGAMLRAGFAHHRYSWIYNAPIPRAQQILRVERKVHTAEHLASAMFHLGVPQSEIPRAQLYSQPRSSANPYAVIHAMASAPDKTWPAARFMELARHLQDNCRIEPVFIGTPADNLAPFTRFRTVTPPLEETKSLLAGASLFVGNDSGPAHMAAAFGLPVVVLFAASDPVVWAPWKTRAESIIVPDGMQSLSVQRVVEAVERLYARGQES